MDLLEQNPEYLELLGRAEEAPCTCKEEATNLLQAAENGCLRCCAKFIDQAGQYVNNLTALMWSALNGHLEIARLLIPHEAKMQDDNGYTALMWSAVYGYLDIAKALIAYEAGMQSNRGWTALMTLAEKGHPELVGLLLPYEAGKKKDGDEIATALAAESYQLECVSILLENEVERAASAIAPVMLSAYHGDLEYLIAHQDEWQTICVSWTVLDFALLGRQRRVVRLLTRSNALRVFFAREMLPKITRHNTHVARFLSSHESFTRNLLPFVCAALGGHRSELFSSSLVERLDISRYLRPVSTPDAEWTMWYLRGCGDEEVITEALRSLKHVGFSLSFGRKIVLNFCGEPMQAVSEYLEANPLKKRQASLAEKEAKNEVPQERQIAFREIEPESAFNRDVVTEVMAIVWGSQAVLMCVHDQNTNMIREKHWLGRRLLLDSFRFMERVVAEMLEE